MSGQRKHSMELRERDAYGAGSGRHPGRRRGAIAWVSAQFGGKSEALRTRVRAMDKGGRNERRGQ